MPGYSNSVLHHPPPMGIRSSEVQLMIETAVHGLRNEFVHNLAQTESGLMVKIAELQAHIEALAKRNEVIGITCSELMTACSELKTEMAQKAVSMEAENMAGSLRALLKRTPTAKAKRAQMEHEETRERTYLDSNGLMTTGSSL